MSRKIELSENHRRSLSSSLSVVEKSLQELESMLEMQNNSCFNLLKKDVDDTTIETNISVIQEARKFICDLAEKYGTSRNKSSLQRVITAKKARIWAILSDTKSRKLKRYGTFPDKDAEEYDSDINKLIEITNRLK